MNCEARTPKPAALFFEYEAILGSRYGARAKRLGMGARGAAQRAASGEGNIFATPFSTAPKAPAAAQSGNSGPRFEVLG